MDIPLLIVHITAGSLAILAGAGAVYAGKGAELHRSSGRFFVYAMVVMGLTGTMIAIVRNIPSSMTGGLVAVYFVVTGLGTVRPLGRRVDIAMIAVAWSIAAASGIGAARVLAAGHWFVRGVPVAMIIFMGSVMLFAGIADVRLLRAGGIAGPRRIARHLWRMCFGFWVATGSFFLGQMDEFPVWLQNGMLMSIPAFFPLAVMVYWLWRVRYRRMLAGMTIRQAVTTGSASAGTTVCAVAGPVAGIRDTHVRVPVAFSQNSSTPAPSGNHVGCQQSPSPPTARASPAIAHPPSRRIRRAPATFSPLPVITSA